MNGWNDLGEAVAAAATATITATQKKLQICKTEATNDIKKHITYTLISFKYSSLFSFSLSLSPYFLVVVDVVDVVVLELQVSWVQRKCSTIPYRAWIRSHAHIRWQMWTEPHSLISSSFYIFQLKFGVYILSHTHSHDVVRADYTSTHKLNVLH